MKMSDVGSEPKRLGKGDMIEISEGTIISALAVIAIYVLHQNVSLPTEIEAAATVLVYTAVRLAVRYLRDTRLVDIPAKEEKSDG